MSPNGIQFCSLTPSNPDLPLFLFLPGMDGTDLSIQNQLDGLKSAFDVRYLFIPSEDRTPWKGLIKAAIALLQNEIEDFESNARLSRPIYLCGESFGACLALALVIETPDFFDRLVLVNPATSFSQQAWSTLSPMLVKQIPRIVYQLSTFGFLPFLTAWNRVSNQNQQALIKAMQAFTPQSVAWRLSLLQQFHVSPTLLQRIDLPVLLLAALEDKLLPSALEAQKLSRWIPDSRVMQLDHSGHACLLERDIELCQILINTRFLK